jgi:two-component system, cell cycle response regulator DivK
MPKIPTVFNGWRVLVVDDELDNLDIAFRLLKKAGAIVQTAEDGKEALNMVHSFRPDFVLSDLSMPVMDGWLLKDAMGKDRRTLDIPVIALTAHAMPGDRERAIQAGFVNYITKPLDVDKFINNLVRILVDIPEFERRISTEEID